MKRISVKRQRPNPFLQERLEELYKDAKNTNSKLVPMLQEALDSLSKYPLPLKSGAECAILKGFNKKLCLFLDKCLECHTVNTEETQTFQSDHPAREQDNINPSKKKYDGSHENSDSSRNSDDDIQNNSNKSFDSASNNLPSSSNPSSQPPVTSLRRTKSKTYKPAHRSGGYAILIALLENIQENPGKVSLSKDELIEKAQKHSEESFVRPKPDSFYTAWSNMSRLISKGLVMKSKKKKLEYTLTEQGLSVASILLQESANIPTVNDIIFHNAVTHSTLTNTVSETELDISQVTNSQSVSEDSLLIELPAGSFEVVLLIDKNETGGLTKKNDPTVAQFNKYPDMVHEYRNLKVGDFTWIARHRVNKDWELVLPYVVERKRMDDLGHSIKDGRFHEQKFRLRKCGLANVIYMVENYGSNVHCGLPLPSLMQALANTRVHDGFKVHVTDSLSHSARFLAMMTKRITIEYKDKHLEGCNSEQRGSQLMTFNYFNKTSTKSKPLSVTETFIKLLLQLKGVSVEKALAITNVYKTPVALMKAYENCTDQKDGEMLLANLKYGSTNRNVGPCISKSLYHLFSIK